MGKIVGWENAKKALDLIEEGLLGQKYKYPKKLLKSLRI